MRIYWPLVRRLSLTLAAIYLIGGAIMFSAELMQSFDLATPLSIGSMALLVAFVAKLIMREEF
jgi:hypothetical protein